MSLIEAFLDTDGAPRTEGAVNVGALEDGSAAGQQQTESVIADQQKRTGTRL